MKKKPISRYTTEITVGKTLSEIHAMLAENHALAILTEYAPDRVPKSVSFRIQCEYGLIAFQLPARIEAVEKILSKGKRIPWGSAGEKTKARIAEQAARTPWRIIRDWLEAQLAMTQAGLVSMVEIFLPYAQDAQGQTFYESAKASRFPGLLLEDKTGT